MANSLPLQRSTLRSSFRPSPWVWVGVGLLILTIIILVAAPKSYPGGSTYSKSLGDYSQWYAFMERQGHPIQRWRQPYTALKDTGQTLIQIADVEREDEALLRSQEVLDWVERGNTLIQVSWAGQVTGAPFRSDLSSPSGPVRIETTRRYNTGLSSDIVEVEELQDTFGSVVWSYGQGKGRMVRATYPWLAANVYADHAGNFRALEVLATQREGPIWVDEWLHGHRDPSALADAAAPKEQSPFAYLGRQPIAVVAGQAVVLLLLLLWGKNQRFGALTRLSAPSRNSSEQYIQSLADTLEANGHTEYVLTLLGQSFRQRLQTRLGMGGIGAETALSDGAIAQQWSGVTGRSPQELLELLEQTQQEKRLSDRAVLLWVQRSEAILNQELP